MQKKFMIVLQSMGCLLPLVLFVILLFQAFRPPTAQEKKRLVQHSPYKQYCEPAYKLAQSHTDSMIVHVMRPGDTYHGGPTCLYLSADSQYKN